MMPINHAMLKGDRHARRAEASRMRALETKRRALQKMVPLEDQLLSGDSFPVAFRMHEEKLYEYNGGKWARVIAELVKLFDAKSVLDYGCAHGLFSVELRKLLDWQTAIYDYDPVIEGRKTLPQEADIVVCTNVMEHILPASLIPVVDHLNALTQKVLFVSISVPSPLSGPAPRYKRLVSKSAGWWYNLFTSRGFEVLNVHPVGNEWVAVLSNGKLKAPDGSR